jgi:ribosomal protein L22
MSPTKPGDPEKGKPADEEKTEAVAEASRAHAAEGRASEAAATEAAAEEKPAPKRRRRKATPKAEGTAAEETGVGKEAAEAALQEGAGEPASAEPVADERVADEPAADEPAADEPAADEAPATPARRERPDRSRRRRAPGERVTVRAHAKYVRTSARKARLVCDHLRGKSVEEARAILAHTPRAVARDWSKLLESAVANAEHNHELVGDELRIDSVTADEGPTLKRFRPRAYGRATRIRKRTSHLTITLTPKE